VAGLAEGVVIGSALIEALGEADSADSACQAIVSFLAPIRAAMDNTSL
jgi:tryptophan synthase alpha subunit